MKKQTITQFIEHHLGKYATKQDFKNDLDKMIIDLTDDKCSPNQLAFYKRVKNKLAKIEARLEQLRVEIEAERISTGEIIELQSLAKFIDNGDLLLLQWAGVEEFEE